MNRMHHGAQFMLDALVYRQPVHGPEGQNTVIATAIEKLTKLWG